MSDHKREDDREHEVKRHYSPIGLNLGAPQSVKRGYSPIGLTFTSTGRTEPCEEVVRSVKIVSAGPDDPIPVCEGYDLAYIVPNATLSEAAGPPFQLGEFSTVYVFVKFGGPD